MWTYDNSIDVYPVAPGDIWQVDRDSYIVCADIEQGAIGKVLTKFGVPDMSYVDPPWTPSLASGFRTKAGVPRKVDFKVFLDTMFEGLAHTKGYVFCEAGVTSQQLMMDRIYRTGGTVLRWWNTTYYKRSAACLILATWSGYPPVDDTWSFEGMDDEDTPEKALVLASKPGDLVFDCCTGRGLTAVTALSSERRFLGIELSPARMAVTLHKLVPAYAHYSEDWGVVMTGSVSIGIMCHPARQFLWEPLATELSRQGADVHTLIDTGEKSHYKTALRAWQSYNPHCRWHVVLEDDVALSRNFVLAVMVIRETLAAKDALVSGFNMTYKFDDYPMRWATSPTCIWHQCLILGVPQVQEYLAWTDENIAPTCKWGDTALSLWCLAMQRLVWYTVPPMIQHRDENKSLFGNRLPSGKPRISHAFLGENVSLSDFDWKLGMNKPMHLPGLKIADFDGDQWRKHGEG